VMHRTPIRPGEGALRLKFRGGASMNCYPETGHRLESGEETSRTKRTKRVTLLFTQITQGVKTGKEELCEFVRNTFFG